MIQVDRAVLAGPRVTLEPLEEGHARDLSIHGTDDLFRYFFSAGPVGRSEESWREYARLLNQLPNVIPYAITLTETGEAVGCSSFMDIRPEHDALEVGMTWIGRRYQGTFVNPAAKLLMLEHAFERIRCVRVQLKTDRRNLQSQAAIEKLGAVREGVLRHYGILHDGFVRDTVMYSILPAEWPVVKARLMARLSRPG